MSLQPFPACTSKTLVSVTISSQNAADWKAPDHKWTVPLIATVSKLSSFGILPASCQIGLGWKVAAPGIGPSWKLRAALVVLLPKKK
jgi:hypothetical protein